MALDNGKVVSILNDLISICEDGIKGFRTAADATKNLTAKELFTARIPNIERGRDELAAEVRRLGGDPDTRGTVEGALHRGWIDLVAAVTGKNEEAIVSQCVRAEEHAANVYAEALEKDLPPATRAIVDRQYRGVLQNLERVRSFHATLKTKPSAAGREIDREPPARM